ncbi:hypothetical protein [Lysobacter gummosus]|uniref:hypothetical protein n=1 Tax=Lysobacter gummosus TaxID=262324 RepID=UPI00363F7D5F
MEPRFGRRATYPGLVVTHQLSLVLTYFPFLSCLHSSQPTNLQSHPPTVIPANAGSALLRRSRTSGDFRARTFEVAGFPRSRE